MARNKYPEETKNLIVETALKLISEKGYDHTSIQDIIDNLGGLSKGAIYYHFKSKEEIMWAVADRLYEGSEGTYMAICRRTDLNGKEKLRELLRSSLNYDGQEKMMSVAPDLLKNPQLLTLFLENNVLKGAPELLQMVLEEGIRDGSVRTDYPRELAEVIILVCNVWMNPMVVRCDAKEVIEKMKFFRHMLNLFGLDVIDDSMLERVEKITDIYNSNGTGRE